MAHKLFRDSLYDYVQIPKRHPWLLDLIDTPELQRLRYVSQLGMSHITYPGSNHSRFSHSLGVLHLMQQCVRHLKQDHPGHFKQLDEEALLAVALLHDIGHGPFSHATEAVFGNHEERTLGIIKDPKSNVNAVLRKRAGSLPEKAAGLIAKRSAARLWQKSLISSQLDMDRLDYLRRDSLCSGAEYGNFDWFRILHTMELRERELDGGGKDVFITWPNKSRFALEEYIFSRFYMYQSVYFHHTTRGFECLLRKILEKARDMVRRSGRFAKSLLPPLRIILGDGESSGTEAFLNLTDHVVMAQIVLWQSAKDKILSDLAGRFLWRKGLSWEEAQPGLTPMQMHGKIEKIHGYLGSRKLDPAYYFLEDTAKATTYKPYRSASSSEEQSSANSIMLFASQWARGGATGFKEITEVKGLDRLKAITDDSSFFLRYYFPQEHERQIKELLR